MSLRLNTTALSSETLHCLLYRIILSLLILFLLAGTLLAQSEQETKRAEAERLFAEGMHLYADGSEDSLKQALQKFNQALPLFHDVNDQRSEYGSLSNIGTMY